MKRIFFISVFTLMNILFLSCEKDYLDRPPKDKVDANDFFNTAKDLEVYTNSFYSMLPGVSVYTADAASDNVIPLVIADRVRGTRTVPTSKSSGGWDWDELRNINYFLENYQTVPDEEAKKKYSGIARFFRAYFYFKKVKRFGDVPWVSEVLEAGEEGLYPSRDSRVMVMDSVLADIDYAIENIPAEIKLNQITKYTAMLLKARLSLFEGTYRKYHGLGNYEKFLKEAVEASQNLINSGAYSLFTAGGPNEAYRMLFAMPNQNTTETILAADYDEEYGGHDLGYLMTAATQGAWGMPKDMVNSYLMQDGTRFTSIPGHETMGYYEEMQNRDPRLTQTTAGPNFTVLGESSPAAVDLSGTTTGYRIIKALPPREQWGSNASYTDIIIFRYAEALLIYAEAKAELGTLMQEDLDISINELRDRVAMPHLNLVWANANPDPYLEAMYPNVEGPNKGVILEIRRERRIEMYNEGRRWWDLMRWKVGGVVEDPSLGIYFSGLGAHDFNNDGEPDVYLYQGDESKVPDGIPTVINVQQRELTNGTSGNLIPFEGGTFEEPKDYLYPIPLEALALNENLEQNPGW